MSRIRIHADAAAAAAARTVGARAYTVGPELVFGEGQYRPATPAGERLLVHELAHAVQQRHLPAGRMPARLSAPEDRAEVEAERAADASMRGTSTAIGLDAGTALARQPAPDWKQHVLGPGRDVKGPSQYAPGEEPDTFEETWSRRRAPLGGTGTWGWGSPETDPVYHRCTVAPMPRDRFVKFEATLPKQVKRRSGAQTEGPRHPFGVTWPDVAAAVPPEIAAEPVEEDGRHLFRLKPTHAEMAPVRSAYTEASTFREGDAPYYSGGNCPNLRGRAPLIWQITKDGAEKIRAGELEHCADIAAAFDLTLVSYASIINNEAAAERRYRSATATVDATRDRLASLLPPDPVAMLNAYGAMIERTRARDTSGWHMGTTTTLLKPQDNACQGFLGVFDARSFPEVGDGPGAEKHSPDEVMRGVPAPAKQVP